MRLEKNLSTLMCMDKIKKIKPLKLELNTKKWFRVEYKIKHGVWF